MDTLGFDPRERRPARLSSARITYKGDNTMNFRTIEHYTNRINSLRAKDEVANAALIRKCQRRLKALIARG